MSGDFNVGADASVNMSAGSAGAVGSGAYTIAMLVRPTTGNNNCGFVRCDASGVQQRGFFEDALALFGANDFSSGFGALTQGNWYVVAQSKAAGSNLFRMHFWAYASDGSGTMSHGTAVGAANQGDGSAIDAIRIGIADDRGNGLVAVAGFWTSALSDGSLDTLKSGSLSAWSALSPQELISLENWNGSTGCTAVVGTSTQSSITGTVGTGANPPSFSFSLSSAAGPSAARTLPPPPLLYFLAARNQAQWRNTSSTQDATVSASTVAGTTAVGTATVQTGSTVTGIAAVAGVATVGSVTITSSVSITPATVAGTTAVGAVTVQTGGTVSPAAVAGTATVGAPTVRTGSTVTPATVAGTASIPTPSVSAGGNATVSPSTVAGTTSVGSHTIGAGSSVFPATVAGTATAASPTVKTSVTITLTTVAGVAAIAAPTVSGAPQVPGTFTSASAGSSLAASTSTARYGSSTASGLHASSGP